jgi:hypothetical protein
MPAKKSVTLIEATRIGAGISPAAALPLPHEKDEGIAAPAAPAAPQPAMIQAQRDVARGLEDTDCYSRLGKLIPLPRKR